MATRQVDVTIKGRNQTSSAFKAAGLDVDSFRKRITRLVNPLNVLKGVFVGLGIASLGALFRKATTAAIDHEKALGRNVATLDRLSAAWDFVLVRLGQAILGLDQTGGFADQATQALAGFGQWIEDNKGGIQDFANIVMGVARGLKAIPGAIRGAAMGLHGIDPKMLLSTGGVTRSFGSGFESFQREREEARRREEAARVAKQAKAEAERAAKQEQKRIQESFDKSILPMLGTGSSGHAGTGKSAIGITGSAPGMVGPSGVPSLGVTVGEDIGAMQGALADLDDSIRGIAKGSIVEFADAWADATQEMIAGSANLGSAIIKAGRRAVGGVLIAKGRETLLDAAKAAIQGFENPIHFLRAAKLFAIGTAQAAAGQMFAGGGGGGSGGGGGLGSDSFQRQQDDASGRGDATLVIQGGLLDVSDPRQADALAAALAELSGRRVIVVGGAA